MSEEQKSAEERMRAGFARLDQEENQRLQKQFGEEKENKEKTDAEENAVKGS